jgi:BirA family biotin operon repressor/biotin-[acetyl-CoA-carboxylase] ligase
MKTQILHILKNSKDYVSGEELSKLLGVSRTAIWKHIANLRAEGYAIESITKKGHLLLASPEVVYGEEVSFGLTSQFIGRPIIFKDKVDSTNNLAKKYADEGCDQGLTVIAEEQTGGKGRLSRPWQSPTGVGVWMSIVLRPKVEPLMAPQLALLAAAAVAGGISLYSGLKAEIKWPNDILIDGKKICGILTEMKSEMEYIHYCVIGIGINVNTPQESFSPDLLHKAGSLRMFTGKSLQRAGLIRSILQEIEKLYICWLKEGFEPVRKIWLEKSCTLNHNVAVNTPGGAIIEGLAKDIDESGALIIDQAGVLKKITAGDVHLVN